jgi:hypothetical protein
MTSHGHFDTRGNMELRKWFKGRAEPQELRRAVSLQVDVDTRHSLDNDLLTDFVSALPNCRQARVEVQGQLSGVFLSTVPPPSRIHRFSWISATLGVRHPIPLDNFPWRILVDDLPWAQLTHLSLDCPLSDKDAFLRRRLRSAGLRCFHLRRCYLIVKLFTMLNYSLIQQQPIK